MRTMSLRALHRDPPASEAVQVTRDGEIVGTFIPVGAASPDAIQLAAGPIAAAPVLSPHQAATARRMSQAERDKVLRRVAKA